ncbi:hypothetical protein C8J57DRAFT_1211439 [Mycena rebaudengoi]|nr:hypothetical protein C8J57DRAFT_1211439 [Mycena rebaudengoi]
MICDALPKLTELRVDTHDPCFLTILAYMKLLSLRKLLLIDSSVGQELFFSTHGLKLIELDITYNAVKLLNINLLDACPNLSLLSIYFGSSTLYMISLSKEALSDWGTFFSTFDSRNFPNLKEITENCSSWPTTEREISRKWKELATEVETEEIIYLSRRADLKQSTSTLFPEARMHGYQSNVSIIVAPPVLFNTALKMVKPRWAAVAAALQGSVQNRPLSDTERLPQLAIGVRKEFDKFLADKLLRHLRDYRPRMEDPLTYCAELPTTEYIGVFSSDLAAAQDLQPPASLLPEGPSIYWLLRPPGLFCADNYLA